MKRPVLSFPGFLLSVFMLTGVFATPALAQDKANDPEKLVGTWKLVSLFTEDVQTKQRNNVYGERPSGYLTFTPGRRFFAVITAEGRTAPKSPEEQAAAYRSVLAYTGKWSTDGDKFTVVVDVAWNEGWVGTQQVRFWRLEGTRLFLTTAPLPNPYVAGNLMIGTLIWEREE